MKKLRKILAEEGLLKRALDTGPVGPEDLSELSSGAQRAIQKYLGRGFLIVSDMDSDRVDFQEDDPYAPDTMRDGSSTISFGTIWGVGSGQAVRVERGGGYGSFYLVAK